MAGEGGEAASDEREVAEPDTPKRARKKLTLGNLDTIKRGWDLGCRERGETTGRARALFAGQLLGYRNRTVDGVIRHDFARSFARQHPAKPTKWTGQQIAGAVALVEANPAITLKKIAEMMETRVPHASIPQRSISTWRATSRSQIAISSATRPQ
jgi:hypothetical protein